MMTDYMYFYVSPHVKFLFKSAEIKDSGWFSFAVLITFALAFLVEFLDYLKFSMQMNLKKKLTDILASAYNEEEAYQISKQSRIKMSFIYCLQLFLSYILMLIVMTFNVGLFLAAVFGLATSYLIFGFSTAGDDDFEFFNPETDMCCTKME